MSSLQSRTALVTGASSGLGADFARQLAQRGANLVLVARRAQNLQQLAQELTAQHSIRAEAFSADLGRAEERQRLGAELKQRVDILINNAGLGIFGRFCETPWDRYEQMLHVDILALTHLTHLFLPAMRERGWGRILQVASTAAFQPCPGYAAYAGAKSYVLSFSQALNHELGGTGVSCTTLCPGVTATEFFQVAGQQMTLFQRLSMMESPEVARQGLEALLAQRSYVVAGRLNTLMALGTRLLPNRLLTAMAARLMK